MEITTIILLVTYLLIWALIVRYDVHMFQQNSYRVNRYLNWYKQCHAIPFTSIALGMGIVSLFASPVALCVASVVAVAILAVLSFGTKQKTPLVYTMRVKRLLFTSLLLTAAIIALVWWLNPIYTITIAYAILMVPMVMLGANIINKPIEAYIARWYYNDAKRILQSMPHLTIIGITGSFGKTSTKHYLYRILSEKYNVLMTPGNFNTTLGVVRTIREHLKPHHEIFIVEMGAKQTGDIKEICDLVHPTIGIVTAVGEMHLETFHTVENILHTKFELIEALPTDGMGVINLDSERIAGAKIHRHGHIVGYGVENTEADYRATQIQYSSRETRFCIDCRGDIREGYTTHLAGRGNILNLLAAIAVADKLAVSEALQKRAIRQIEQIEHRLNIRHTTGGVAIIDDAYNSNPSGAKMALEVLRQFERPQGARAIVVTPGFVELGERQEALNRELGEQIAASCDIAIVVNKTNREAIVKGIRSVGFNEEKLIIADSFAEATSKLTPLLRSGDVVLYENDLPDSFK